LITLTPYSIGSEVAYGNALLNSAQSQYFSAENSMIKPGSIGMTINRKSQILVVDDSGAMRSIVRKLLVQLGYIDVDEAPDGAAALAKINEKPYGLVISDWNMEPMNGQVLLERVRANKKFANLPFIMMTAESDPDKIIESKYAGVSSFISKPFSADALQSKISKINAE
jgi:two-component system chemotaxis response regulator CheY